jgi:uncharacterized protein (TIGR03437 family)
LRTPIISAPDVQQITPAQNLFLTISALEPGGANVVLKAENLPAGASFDTQTGAFSWKPLESQIGVHTIGFTATSSAGAASTRAMRVEVGSGKPAADTLGNAATPGRGPACSPGALASISGKWLTRSATDVGGTSVKVNGQEVPVLYSSPRRIDFQCPAVQPGTALEVLVENPAGAAVPLKALVQTLTPGIFSLDRSGERQGLVTIGETANLAMQRNAKTTGQPAQPGDTLVIWMTGLGLEPERHGMFVKIGDMLAEVERVREAPGSPGLQQVEMLVPQGVVFGNEVPISVQMLRPGGQWLESNTVTIAIEAVRR